MDYTIVEKTFDEQRIQKNLERWAKCLAGIKSKRQNVQSHLIPVNSLKNSDVKPMQISEWIAIKEKEIK